MQSRNPRSTKRSFVRRVYFALKRRGLYLNFSCPLLEAALALIIVYNAVALCHHFSFVLFPTFFRSSSMLSDYYGILSYCRRIVQSLFISDMVLCRQSLQYLQIKIRTMYFYTVPVSIIYILLLIIYHPS